jgi:hypothetical protein
MKKQFARSLQWFRVEVKPMSTKTGLYETIKQFELRADESTKVVTSVSAKTLGKRIFFRVATLREHAVSDGTVRRSPWLGVREMALKAELEKRALQFIAEESARLKLPGMTFSA